MYQKHSEQRFYKYPQVSVIVVTHNNEKIIHPCIHSILKNNYPNYELIIVDNGSTDRTLQIIKELIDKFNAHDKTKIIANNKNLGISKASNIGAHFSSGKYLAFLDSDAIVDPNWLFQPIEIMEKDETIAATQSKILKAYSYYKKEKIIDSAGGLMDLSFRSYVRGQNKPDEGQYDKIEEIFYPTHTGSIIRKKAFTEIGGFDDLFFMDLHDVDLGWRFWIKGYKVVFAPKSIVYHRRGGSRKKPNYSNTKNYLTMVVKNLDANKTIAKYLVYHLTQIIIEIIKHKNQKALARFCSLFIVLKNFNKIYSRKIFLKNLRRNGLKEILKRCSNIILKEAPKQPFRYRIFSKQ